MRGGWLRDPGASRPAQLRRPASCWPSWCGRRVRRRRRAPGSLGYRTQVLQRIFHAASSTQTTVLADADITGEQQGYLTAAQLAFIQRQLAAGMHQDGLPLAPAGAQWSA